VCDSDIGVNLLTQNAFFIPEAKGHWYCSALLISKRNNTKYKDTFANTSNLADAVSYYRVRSHTCGHKKFSPYANSYWIKKNKNQIRLFL
jgi:hypothetical protein